MSAQKKTASSVLGAALGTLGFSVLAGVLVTVMVAPAIAVTGMTANNSLSVFESLPSYIKLNQQSQQNTLWLTDADGTYTGTPGTAFKIATVYDQNRQELPLASISPYLQQAAIAGEDRRFEEHGGVDLPSVVRAAIGGGQSGGASTLTMQTVRNILVLDAFNNPANDTKEKRDAAIKEATEVSVGRKLKEMKLAISLEKQYTKDEILQAYLNVANFGGNTYGVQAAASQYFSVNATDLTIAQAASIVAIVQNPTRINLGNQDNWQRNQQRRDKIIRDMNEVGFITDAERDEALATPVDANFVKISKPLSGCRYANLEFRSFCDYMLKSVKDLTSLGSTVEERQAAWKKGGYQLYGTLNTAAQVVAQNQIQRYVPSNYTATNIGASAVSIEVGTGRILTMAQSKIFDDGLAVADPSATAVNFNTDQAYGGSKGFQPGSTYKPYTLLTWLDQGKGLNSSFEAGITTLNQARFKDSCNGPYVGSYKFRNDARESGSYNITRATGASVNSVFLQMAMKLDQCDIRTMAQAIGVHSATGAADGSDMETRPSCVIGGCQTNVAPMTQAAAYAAIAGQGIFCKPKAIDAIVAPDGSQLPPQDAGCAQTVRKEVADAAAQAMAAVLRATASRSNPNDGTPYIGKTGTTNDAIHTWMVGSSTKVSTAVWVGNIAGKTNLRQTRINGTQAAVLRHDIFKPLARAIDSIYPGTAFPKADSSMLSGKPTFVPDVTGASLSNAQSTIENADLTFADGGQIDSDKPVGTVVSTDPAAGSAVSGGTTVTVYTSNGQGAAVPDVSSAKNQDFDAAKAALQAAGFANVEEGCVAGTLPTAPEFEKVVSQDPAAGSVANKGATITLKVAKVNC